MVSIVKRKKGNEAYYYLYHDKRNGKRVQKEIYLGKQIPKNIDEIKQEFLINIYKEDWIPQLEKIKKNHSKEKKTIPFDALKKQIQQFSVKFTYNTQRIEGSTLTLKETFLLLEDGITPPDRSINDTKEAEAHQKLFFEILEDKTDISKDKTLTWHDKLLNQTKPTIAGKLREHDVRIGGSKFTPPKHRAVPLLVKGFFEWYNRTKSILNPVILAALVHLKFVIIHPFADGNGRISRLMMNFVLHKFEYPMLDIDYKDRRSYYNALERAQTKNDDFIFLNWFIKRYLKAHKKYYNNAS